MYTRLYIYTHLFYLLFSLLCPSQHVQRATKTPTTKPQQRKKVQKHFASQEAISLTKVPKTPTAPQESANDTTQLYKTTHQTQHYLIHLFVTVSLPFPTPFGKAIEDSLIAAVIAALAFVEEAENVEVGFYACFAAAVKSGIEVDAQDGRVAAGVVVVIIVRRGR